MRSIAAFPIDDSKYGNHQPVQNLGDAEIAKFDDPGFGEEYILRFDVAMKNFPVVDVFQRQADLNEPIHDLETRQFDFWYIISKFDF